MRTSAIIFLVIITSFFSACRQKKKEVIEIKYYPPLGTSEDFKMPNLDQRLAQLEEPLYYETLYSFDRILSVSEVDKFIALAEVSDAEGNLEFEQMYNNASYQIRNDNPENWTRAILNKKVLSNRFRFLTGQPLSDQYDEEKIKRSVFSVINHNESLKVAYNSCNSDIKAYLDLGIETFEIIDRDGPKFH